MDSILSRGHQGPSRCSTRRSSSRNKQIESFRDDPENFKASYAAWVVVFGIVVGQAMVRWYKYNTWLPAPESLDKSLDLTA